jgi:hypothetical protein
MLAGPIDIRLVIFGYRSIEICAPEKLNSRLIRGLRWIGGVRDWGVIPTSCNCDPLDTPESVYAAGGNVVSADAAQCCAMNDSWDGIVVTHFATTARISLSAFWAWWKLNVSASGS